MKNFVQPDKSKLRQIPISEFADFINANITGSKTEYLVKNIEKWIEENYGKTIHQNDLMPPKSLMADLLDISTGTVQNIYRQLENKGLVYSKQCIGTLIADIKNKNSTLRKSSSKRDFAVELIKTFILKNNFKKGEQLPSVRAISQYINIPINTTGSAMEALVGQGIVEKTSNKDQSWILKTDDFDIKQDNSITLISKVANDLKNYISSEIKIGEKLPTHQKLAEKMKVSIKTIHDALTILTQEGILLPKRGRYGTCVVKIPNSSNLEPNIESSVFAKSQFTAGYRYNRIQDAIKNLIIEKYSINSKLPSIMEMSTLMDVSPNTIRKAFNNLEKEGLVYFTRGRYGGTFVKSMPTSPDNQPFEWVAVNPKYNNFN